MVMQLSNITFNIMDYNSSRELLYLHTYFISFLFIGPGHGVASLVLFPFHCPSLQNFRAQKCTHTPANRNFFGPIPNLLSTLCVPNLPSTLCVPNLPSTLCIPNLPSTLCILMEILSHTNAKGKRKELGNFKFALLLFVFK